MLELARQVRFIVRVGSASPIPPVAFGIALRVRTVQTLAEALAWPGEADLLLVEVHSLLEARRLHEALPCARLPVLAVLAPGMEELGFEALRCGADDFMIEPTPEALGQAIARCLHRRRRPTGRADGLGELAHEIRTPLSGVMGIAGLLAETGLDPRQREYVRILRSSGEELLTLLRDLLDLERADAGRLDLEETEFSLRDLLARTVRLHRAPADEGNAGLRLDLDPESPDRMVGDPLRLQQVVRNLISNAVRFSQGQEVVVRVRTLACEQECVQVQLSVIDRGPGIPEDRQSAIFEPWRQADASVARRHGGAGLGLALCSRILRKMDGRIRVDSAPGRGTTFEATMRFRLAEPQAPTSPPLPGRVLVVHPDPTERHLLEHNARRLGLEVHSAASLDEGLRVLDPPDLVVVPEGAGGAVRRSGGPPVVEVGDGSGRGALQCDGWLLGPVAAAEFETAVRPLLSPSTAAPARPLATADGVRVLLADDDAACRTMMSALLERRGCYVQAASTAAEAMDAFRGGCFDLVLLDLHLPDGTGDALASAMRAEESRTERHACIVALTAAAGQHVESRCRRAGMDRLLLKPLDPTWLDLLLASLEPRNSFDMAVALERMAGHPEILRQTSAAFVDTAGRCVAEAREALARGDRETLARAAHTLKGGAALLAADLCTQRAAALEREAAAGDLDTLVPLLDRLEGSLQRLEEDLRHRVLDHRPVPAPPMIESARRRLLLVEDDPAQVPPMRRQLEEWGYEVRVARDGAEAWRVLKADASICMVLTDWMMPGGDGLELCRRIRAMRGRRYVHVLMLSARATADDVLAGLGAGVDAFLPKPCDPERLRAQILGGERVLGHEEALEGRLHGLQKAHDHARRELRIAARVQRSLLPRRPPVLSNCEFAWFFQSIEGVAGDMFGLFPLGQGRVGMYVLDVSGHGVPAALLSATLSRVLHPSWSRDGIVVGPDGPRSPGEVLREVNRRFPVMDQSHQFFTMFYGVLDRHDRTFRFSCAGHPAPLVRKADGACRPLECQLELALGIQPSIDAPEGLLQLQPGDALFLPTDGVLEARDPQGRQFGHGGLERALAPRAADEDLKTTLHRLKRRLRRFCGDAGLRDDATMLAFRLLPPARPLPAI